MSPLLRAELDRVSSRMGSIWQVWLASQPPGSLDNSSLASSALPPSCCCCDICVCTGHVGACRELLDHTSGPGQGAGRPCTAREGSEVWERVIGAPAPCVKALTPRLALSREGPAQQRIPVRRGGCKACWDLSGTGWGLRGVRWGPSTWPSWGSCCPSPTRRLHIQQPRLHFKNMSDVTSLLHSMASSVASLCLSHRIQTPICGRSYVYKRDIHKAVTPTVQRQGESRLESRARPPLAIATR